MDSILTSLKDNTASIAAGFVSALLVAVIAMWRADNSNPIVVLIVFTITTMPILVFGWKVLWFDRETYDAERKKAMENVENKWEQEAAAFAFWALSGGLVFMETVGNAFDIGWMSPINLMHFLILGGISFFGYYLWQKRIQG